MIAPPDIADKILAASSSSHDQLLLIKQLRNAIVGHDDEKLEHATTNAIPVLLSIVSDTNASTANRVEAATTIASFSIGMLCSCGFSLNHLTNLFPQAPRRSSRPSLNTPSSPQ